MKWYTYVIRDTSSLPYSESSPCPARLKSNPSPRFNEIYWEGPKSRFGSNTNQIPHILEIETQPYNACLKAGMFHT